MERVLKPIEAKRLSQTVAIVTADGTLGERGGVLDALPEAVERSKAQVIYAAALRRARSERIAAFCRERGLPAQMALEERMGCGYGLCHTCVVPVARKDGSGYDHLRACVDGPVFNPAASCGIGGSASDRRCCRRRRRACPSSVRGRDEPGDGRMRARMGQRR